MKTLMKYSLFAFALCVITSCQNDDPAVEQYDADLNTATKSDNPAAESNNQTQEPRNTREFPVDLDSEEGKAFLKEHEYPGIYKYFDIPEDILPNISTPDLVKLCAEWPWNYFHLFGYDDMQISFAQHQRLFNGIPELLKRKDNADVIFDYVRKLAEARSEYPDWFYVATPDDAFTTFAPVGTNPPKYLEDILEEGKHNPEESKYTFEEEQEMGLVADLDAGMVILSLCFGQDGVLENMSIDKVKDVLAWYMNAYQTTHDSFFGKKYSI